MKTNLTVLTDPRIIVEECKTLYETLMLILKSETQRQVDQGRS